MRRSLLLALFVLLVGCTHVNYPFSVDELMAQGYAKSNITSVTTSGERRESTNYQIWWKETREEGRRLNLCCVPLINQAGYAWRAAVFVDDREIWSHDTAGGYGKPSLLLQGVHCATSDPLPDGKVAWRTWYTYWH